MNARVGRRVEQSTIACVGSDSNRSNAMRSKTLLFVAAFLLTPGSLALGQSSSSGTSGSTGSSSTTGSTPGTAPAGTQNSIPSGTGPTPAPTPGQSFTFPSNSGTP